MLFAVGFLLTGLFARRLRLDTVTRLALAVPALVGFVALVMVIHIVTGGGVLSHPWVTWTATAAGLGSAIGASRSTGERGWWGLPDVRIALGLVVIGIAIWCLPVFTNLPVSFHGDAKRHMAWAAQLAAGHSTPTAVITGEVPNYYPWLFHALTAFTATFTPGGRVLHALGPLQVLAVMGSVLAFFAAGRALFESRVAAVSSALFGALAGGFGFLLARGPALVTDPRVDAELYGGDFLFLRSYNIALHNLAPPFPRDFGFVLLVAMVLLLTLAFKNRQVAPLVGAGCALGLIGLTTGESLIVGAAFALAFVALGPGIARWRALAAISLPALAIAALWLVPLAINYARLGGFADTSGEPISLPPQMILFSWGIPVVFALVAVATWRQWPATAARVVIGFLAAAVAALVVAGLAPKIDDGFTTLARHHRYWPLVSIGVALVAAFGAEIAWRRLASAGNALAGLIVALVVGAAVATPVLASIEVTRQPIESHDLADALRGDTRNVLNVLARNEGVCTAAVPAALSRAVPAYTGARLVYLPSETHNQAGIRWPSLSDEIPDDVRRADNGVLLAADPGAPGWADALERYGVDRLVVPAPDSLPPLVDHVPFEPSMGDDGPYLVFETAPCD